VDMTNLSTQRDSLIYRPSIIFNSW